MSIWVTHHRDKKGHLAGKLSEDIVGLLGRSQRAEAARRAIGNRYLSLGKTSGSRGGREGGKDRRGQTAGGGRGSETAGGGSDDLELFPELEQAEVAPVYFVPLSKWQLDSPLNGTECGFRGDRKRLLG